MIRLRLLLALLLGTFVLPGSSHAAVALDGPAGLALFAASLSLGLAAAACCLAVVRLEPAAAPAVVRSGALAGRARRSAFVRLRDPDDAGRPKPRAPGAAQAAAHPQG